MSTTFEVQSSVQPPQPGSMPVDEAVWKNWLHKNAREERERAATRTRTVKWICIIALMAAALFSASFFTTTDSSYQTSLRFVISLGGLAVLMQSVRTRQYGFTVVFVGIMLLFNPLLPAFGFSGKWAILLAGIIPFAASLIWMKGYTQGLSTLLANGGAQLQ